MWWRSTRKEFEAAQGDGNRAALRRLADAATAGEGEAPGLLAYDAAAGSGAPVAWVSVGPRQDYGSLERSPVLRRLDDEPVWSIVCFFVARPYRRRGVGVELIRGAVEHARRRGARIVEAYPTVPRGRRLPPVSTFMGLPAQFAAAGFEEVARPSAAKAVWRLRLDP
jgi:GNAT superfamily N-acetyltransferase